MVAVKSLGDIVVSVSVKVATVPLKIWPGLALIVVGVRRQHVVLGDGHGTGRRGLRTVRRCG